MKKFRIICISIILFCSILLGVCGGVYHHYKTLFNKMDASELHHDADGWFIMVDKTNDIIGIYKGTKPIHHIIGGTDNFEECYEVDYVPTFIYGGKDTRWYEDYNFATDELNK